MKRLCLMIWVFGLILSVTSTADCAIYDDFEDGIIDLSLWVTHGYKGGVGGVGAGSWQYSISEVMAVDGYLQARVWGPTSGNTYGAEAWIRTTYNFNDRQSWLLNFTWETTISYRPHVDNFAIQITDGGTLDNCNWFWLFDEPFPGTVSLWRTATDRPPDVTPLKDYPIPPFPKSTWSIVIDPLGFATLYQSPNANGTPYRKIVLDTSKAWYLKFLLNDATSAGFDGGDNTFRLYHFAAGAGEEGVPPIANAGDDIVADANEEVTLDASNSSDPDGEIIRYTWKRLPDSVVIYSGPDPNCQTRALGRVEEVIELTVIDNYLATATDTVKIISRTIQGLQDQIDNIELTPGPPGPQGEPGIAPEEVQAMQSQIEGLQQQNQKLQTLLDKITSWPPIRHWLRSWERGRR